MDAASSALTSIVYVGLYLMEVLGGPLRPGAPPPKDLLGATRLNDGQIELSYVYAAPNGCWQKGDVQLVEGDADEMIVSITPDVVGDICTQAITFLDYSGIYQVPQPFEILTINLVAESGEIIETTQMLIQ